MGWDETQFDCLRGLVPGLVTPTLRGGALDAMVAEVGGVVRPGDVLGGVSMGAAVSLAYAAGVGAVCSRLVLIAPADGEEAARYLDWLAATLSAGGFEALRAEGEPMADFWEARFSVDSLLALWRSRPWVDVPPVRVPARVVAWRGDALHPWDAAESLAARVGADLVEIPTPTGLTLPAPELAAALFPE